MAHFLQDYEHGLVEHSGLQVAELDLESNPGKYQEKKLLCPSIFNFPCCRALFEICHFQITNSLSVIFFFNRLNMYLNFLVLKMGNIVCWNSILRPVPSQITLKRRNGRKFNREIPSLILPLQGKTILIFRDSYLFSFL